MSISISPSLLKTDEGTGVNSCFKMVSTVVCPVASNLIMQTYAVLVSYTLISTTSFSLWLLQPTFHEKLLVIFGRNTLIVIFSMILLPQHKHSYHCWFHPKPHVLKTTISRGWVAVSNLFMHWSNSFLIFSQSWSSVIIRIAISSFWSLEIIYKIKKKVISLYS